MRIHVRGARLIDPAHKLDQPLDLWIADGVIAAVGQAPIGFTVDRVIEAAGLIACPGLVDLRARLREPGQEHKGTIASECAAAASGGITTLCCPPDTDPVNDTPAVTDLIQHRAREAGVARVVTLGALTKGLQGTQLTEMSALKRAGYVGVSNALRPITDTQVLRRALEYAASLDFTVYLHAEDPWLASGSAHEGPVSTRLGLTGIPETAETIALSRDLLLIEQTGVRAHFGNLSTARAVQLVEQAQREGLPVTADVAAHQLHLTDMDVADFNTYCHVRPPLRSMRDRDALRAGVQSGVIAAVCSDHQPHDVDAKLAPFADAEPGISALETLLPLTLRAAATIGMSLPEALATLTTAPARILGIDCGLLGVGKPADVCIFDPDEEWLLNENDLVSHGRNSPFIGWALKARVRWTLVGGIVVFNRRED
jgi:dihydroorotase